MRSSFQGGYCSEGESKAHAWYLRGWGAVGFALVIATLGIGVLTWIGVGFGWISFSNQRSLAARSAASVGESAPPRSPIKIVTHDDACLVFKGSFLQGDTLRIYVQNTCSKWLADYPNYRYAVEAADGTVLESGRYAFDGDTTFAPDEKREQTITINDDNRITTIEAWALDPH